MVSMLKFLLLGSILLGLRGQNPVTVCKGGDECCDGITCGLNEGDCDSHKDCVGHLRCGEDNCDGPGFDSTDDCCYEDPAFPPPPPPKDLKMCETRWRFEQNIVQAASALGCGFAKGVERKISLDECSQTSCSSKLIGESFTCNNQNKEETCTELENLHLDVQDRINTQCKQMLRGVARVACPENDCLVDELCCSGVCTKGTCCGDGECNHKCCNNQCDQCCDDNDCNNGKCCGEAGSRQCKADAVCCCHNEVGCTGKCPGRLEKCIDDNKICKIDLAIMLTNNCQSKDDFFGETPADANAACCMKTIAQHSNGYHVHGNAYGCELFWNDANCASKPHVGCCNWLAEKCGETLAQANPQANGENFVPDQYFYQESGATGFLYTYGGSSTGAK